MQDDQGNTYHALSNIPVKRKRGRPRKYPRIDPQDIASPVPRNHNLNLGESSAIPPPPGFIRNNGNHAQQAATNGTTDNMVGMAVSGVVEASFDAGYLLRVKVGNSDTILRGIVLKPGHYAPVVPDIDVAPALPMIRRHEVPLPSHFHGQYPRSTDTSRSFKRVTSEGRQASPANVNPVMSRGNLMPVVLQPSNVSNGLALTSESNPSASQASNLESSKGKQVLSMIPTSNGCLTPINQALTVNGHQAANLEPSKGKQVLSTASPSNGCLIPTNQASTVNGHQVMHVAKINENATIGQPSVENQKLHEAEAKSTGLPDKICSGDLVTKVPAPSQSAVNHLMGSNPPCQPSVAVPEKDHPASTSETIEDGRNDKMSELLQESMIERMNDQTQKLFGDDQDDDSSPSQAP